MKVGDYARTKNGNIFKIEDITDVSTLDYSKKIIFDSTGWYTTNDEIIKCEEKPIDLVQVGDYVNGCYIQKIFKNKNGIMECLLDSDYEFSSIIKNDEIKSIVTKEQFKSMEYRIGK